MEVREYIDKSGDRYVWKEGYLRCYPARKEKEWVKKIRNFFKTVFGIPTSSAKV